MTTPIYFSAALVTMLVTMVTGVVMDRRDRRRCGTPEEKLPIIGMVVIAILSLISGLIWPVMVVATIGMTLAIKAAALVPDPLNKAEMQLFERDCRICELDREMGIARTDTVEP